MGYKVTDEDDPDEMVPTEVLAQSIVEISIAIKKLRTGRLSDKAIILLIQGITKQTQAEIKKVLDACEMLESTYIKKLPGAKAKKEEY